jgi:hypothetical protein
MIFDFEMCQLFSRTITPSQIAQALAKMIKLLHMSLRQPDLSEKRVQRAVWCLKSEPQASGLQRERQRTLFINFEISFVFQKPTLIFAVLI